MSTPVTNIARARRSLPTTLPRVLPPPVEHQTPGGRAALGVSRDGGGGKRRMNALLASAQRLTRKSDPSHKTTGPGNAASTTKGVQVAGWQEDAWGMYDIVGEQRYLANTLANQLGKARLLVGRLAENGEGLSEEELPDEVLHAFEAFGGSATARSQIVSRLGVNLFIAGEGWLAGIPERLFYGTQEVVEDDNPLPFIPALTPVNRTEEPAGLHDVVDELGEDDAVRLAADEERENLVWRMLSVSEVTTTEDEMARIVLPEDGGRTLEVPLDELFLIRVWRPHPRNAAEADSPTRASLPVLRELVGLTMHISAQVDSRLAGAGLLEIPQSAARALAQSAGPGMEEDEEDYFTEALMLAMETAIKDRDSASALVPLVITVPDEAAGKIQHITFSSPLDAEARNLRDEAIRRLALSQDAPPEVLLGTGDMNHWGAWLVQEETVSTHLEPPLALICDALTTEYLHPVLEAAGVVDFEQYVIGYDVDALVASPTKGADAQSAYGLGVISDKAVREALGFEETDAPFGDVQLDRARTTAYEMVTKNPTLIESPGIAAIVDQLTKLLTNKPLGPAAVDGAPVADSVSPGGTPTPGVAPAPEPAADSGDDGRGDHPAPPATVGTPDLSAPSPGSSR